MAPAAPNRTRAEPVLCMGLGAYPHAHLCRDADDKRGVAAPEGGPRVEAELNPWITVDPMGNVQYSNEPAGLGWSGIPMFTPTIAAVAAAGGSFLVGWVGAKPSIADKPAPPGILGPVETRPNLVYYDWEITPGKLAHLVYLGQTARLASCAPAIAA